MLSRRLYLPAVRAGHASLPKIVAVDLQPMAPIEGVTLIQGEVTALQFPVAASASSNTFSAMWPGSYSRDALNARLSHHRTGFAQLQPGCSIINVFVGPLLT